MGFWRIVLLGAALCAPAAAQLKLSVNQLRAFIESSIKLKHEDRKVAQYLKKVQLTERLEARVVEDLQGLGAGPRTVEALNELAAASASLAKASPPPAKPVRTAIPPPSAAEQREIIDRVRDYALNYTKGLPNFICTQVTRRYYDPTGLEFWRTADTVTEKLSYFDQKENYEVILVNNRPMNISHNQLDGASSSGEFGSLMKEIFEPSSETSFAWLRWGTLRGRRNHVYAYNVRQEKSKWNIVYQKSASVTPGYRGLIYVDADLQTVSRITLEAVDIPPTFPVQQASTTLDYDFIPIGESEHVLPLRAEVRMREGRHLVKNEVEFRMYRKFGAEATIKFETPEPLSEELTKEQPAEEVKPPQRP